MPNWPEWPHPPIPVEDRFWVLALQWVLGKLGVVLGFNSSGRCRADLCMAVYGCLNLGCCSHVWCPWVRFRESGRGASADLHLRAGPLRWSWCKEPHKTSVVFFCHLGT